MAVGYFSIIFNFTLFSLTIHCERSQSNRTLINQLVASTLWRGVQWNIFVQPVMTSSYFFIPTFSNLFCWSLFLIGSVTVMHAILLYDSIIIVKYIFIVWLKTPTVLQDDFWRLFINLWIFGFCVISEIVFILMPGRPPMDVSICFGKIPIEYMNVAVKRNLPILIVGSLSIILNFGLYVRMVIFEHFTAGTNNLYEQFYLKWANVVTKQGLFYFTSHIAATLILFFSLVSTPQVLYTMDPALLDKYPNHNILYMYNNFYFPMSVALIIVSFLYKSTNLRQLVWREFKEIVSHWLHFLPIY